MLSDLNVEDDEVGRQDGSGEELDSQQGCHWTQEETLLAALEMN